MGRMTNSMCLLMCLVIISGAISQTISGQLTPDFYYHVCPEALPTIRQIVQEAINQEPRMGASLLRLHFHDCFVNGCDASVLLDDTPTFKGEKTASANLNSARGFEVIDDIKTALNYVCKGNVVSCADIVAVAARDSVNILGGGFYEVLLGRRDSLTASYDDVKKNIPTPGFDRPTILSNFQEHGLDHRDLVVLVGAHTIGMAQCKFYQSRIHNDPNIDQQYRYILQKSCSAQNITNPLDFTSTKFDTSYYQKLIQQKGLLHSDQELYKNDGSQIDKLVEHYSSNTDAFWNDFGKSVVKMGNMKTLTGQNGEIRLNCRRIN